jgi:hypothetical protein
LRTTGLAGLDPDTDPSRPKLSPKRKKLKKFIFEEFSVELEASLECPLLGFKKTFMTVFIQIFFFVLKKNHGLDPDSGMQSKPGSRFSRMVRSGSGFSECGSETLHTRT